MFKIYETLGTQALWFKYSKHNKIIENVKYLFFKKYSNFLHHNKDMNTLISMTRKASKEGTKLGSTKNSKDKLEIWKVLINNLNTEEVVKIFKELIEKGNKYLVE